MAIGERVEFGFLAANAMHQQPGDRRGVLSEGVEVLLDALRRWVLRDEGLEGARESPISFAKRFATSATFGSVPCCSFG